MTYDQVIEYFKTQAAAAKALGIRQPSVHAWKEDGIPGPRQYQIEVLTGGALRADRNQPDARA